MSKKNKNKNKHENKDCIDCANCIYICEGDYWCNEENIIVMEEHSPSDNYNYCNGRSFEVA